MLKKLPAVRGRYREHVSLADTTWFRVGGAAEVVFKPDDVEDLAGFLRDISVIPAQAGISQNRAEDSRFRGNDIALNVTILGAASNVVVRDGGIDGVVVRLGRGFNQLSVVSCQSSDDSPSPALPSTRARALAGQSSLSPIGGEGWGEGAVIEAGAACLDVNVAQFALQQGLTGLEFLSGIPGAIGGALRMNAGAYGSEIKDILVKAEAVTPQGEIITLTNEEIGFSYRHCGVPEGTIFTRAWLRAKRGDPATIAARMDDIKTSREDSQPVRARTGGSTFRNPPGHKAWELIDAAGLRGTMIGGAQVSEKHCNFLINTGNATAADLEQLVNEIIRQVNDHSGITLEPEIKFIGRAQ